MSRCEDMAIQNYPRCGFDVTGNSAIQCLQTLKSTGGGSLWAKISGCSPWSRPLMFGSAEREHPRLTNGEIISEEFQPTWSQSNNVTDGQADNMRSQDHTLH